MNCVILVDLQNDFMPGGALAVPFGDEVVPVANQLSRRFDYVVASQDWHPPAHRSFASQHPGYKAGEVIVLDGLEQVLWPDHCVQGTTGSAFHESLDRCGIDAVFQKGTDPAVDSYSAFFDNGRRRSTGLGGHLCRRGVTSVCLMGLATDYCVKFSALDAASLGFATTVVRDGCRGIDLVPGDIKRAWADLERAGVQVRSAQEVP